MTLEQFQAAVKTASQYLTLLQTLGAPFLKERQAGALQLGVASVDLVGETVGQLLDIDDLSWTTLDAEEARIQAADKAALALADLREATQRAEGDPQG